MNGEAERRQSDFDVGEFDEEGLDTIDLEFTPSISEWTEYEIPGGRLRFQLVLRRVRLAVDENGDPVRDAGGNRRLFADVTVLIDEQASEVQE